MTGNRSLDEFAAGEERADPGAAVEDDPPRPESGSTEAAPERPDGADADGRDDPTVEPMVETFAWSADGSECDRCGASVEPRWRDGDHLVCQDCKVW